MDSPPVFLLGWSVLHVANARCPTLIGYITKAFPTSSQRETAGLSSRELEKLSNTVLMLKDLIPYFNDNAFSISQVLTSYFILMYMHVGQLPHCHILRDEISTLPSPYPHAYTRMKRWAIAGCGIPEP